MGEQEARARVIERQSRHRAASGRLVEWLEGLGLGRSFAEQVIEGLRRDGYVDDEGYARAVARARVGRRAESHAALSQRLERLGVAEDAIRRCLATREAEGHSDRQLAADWLRSLHRPFLIALRDDTAAARGSADWEETRRRLMAMLRAAERRGFTNALILAILRRWTIDLSHWI